MRAIHHLSLDQMLFKLSVLIQFLVNVYYQVLCVSDADFNDFTVT